MKPRGEDHVSSLVKLVGSRQRGAVARTKQEWAAFEKSIGIELPGDYKELVNQFGAGSFCDFLWLYSPFCTNTYLTMQQKLEAVARTLRGFASSESLKKHMVPYSWYPEQDGMVVWGGTDNGDMLFWRRAGQNSDFTIVVVSSADTRWCEFQLSISSFLHQVATGQLRVPVFPDDFPGDSITFSAVT